MAKQPQFGYSKMPPSESNLESLLLHSNSSMVLLYTAVSLEVMNVGWMIQSPDPFTCKSDYHVTSPYNIHTLSSKQEMRILKPIRWKFLSWSNTKFL